MSKELFYLKPDLRNNHGFQKYLTPTVFLVLILFLGIALRFYDLGAESYWIDEMYSVTEGQKNLLHVLTSGRLDQPPAYYLPFHFWIQIFGASEAGTRSFSALAGVGSIIFIYLIGQELVGKPVGLISAFLMTISIYQIYYSQETRFYSYFEFMTLVSFFFFILALKSKRLIYFTLYSLASVLMVYSHTYGVFILAAQNLFFIFRSKRYKDLIAIWLIFQALILLALLPSFYLLLFGGSGLIGAISSNLTGAKIAPSFGEPLHTVYRFILPARHDYGQDVVLGSYVAAGVSLVIGVLIFIIQHGKNSWPTIRERLAKDWQEASELTGTFILLFCWLLCPIILPFILSITVSGSLYTERYMISAAPSLYLLLAIGIFCLHKLTPVIVSLGIVAILIIPSLEQYYVNDIKEQWREAATYVQANSEPDDVIVFAPLNPKGVKDDVFNWYYEGDLEDCGLNNELVDPSAISKELMNCVFGHERFWVILPNYPGTSDPQIVRYRSFFLDSSPTGMHKIKENQFLGISVYLFEAIE